MDGSGIFGVNLGVSVCRNTVVLYTETETVKYL